MAERDLPAPGELVVYTDGGCIGNPGPGGWGALLLRSDGYEEIGGREERTTNNRMEMRAAVEALRRARPGDRVHVLTDSRYLQDGISKWIRGWKKRGWKKADGGDVLNRDLWEELDALVSRPGLRVSWEHVRGHSGHLLNERCDQIANGFARGAPPVLERWTEASGAAPAPG
ncbi:MAG: ribonuclease HI, partial [Deferrisomatales bacterium]